MMRQERHKSNDHIGREIMPRVSISRYGIVRKQGIHQCVKRSQPIPPDFFAADFDAGFSSASYEYVNEPNGREHGDIA
jgi:hypothetical protein